jgi:putative transposase
MRKPKQLGFEILENGTKHFGGAYLKNSNAKGPRPISTKHPMHLVVRSEKAVGHCSLLKYDREIRAVVYRQAKIAGVKIYRFANAGNHLHLIILPRSREAFKCFLRAITGTIPRIILKCEKGRPKKLRFWDQRPFTRIASWGKDFRGLSNYLKRNQLEALGFIPYKPRSSSSRPNFLNHRHKSYRK